MPPSDGKFDPWVEEMLDKWVEAKRAKDFQAADAIRADLRRDGIEPDDLRPDKMRRGGGAPQQEPRRDARFSDSFARDSQAGNTPPSGSWWIEAELDKWVDAKRAKDYARADDIRASLRKQGADPDRLRPPGWTPTVIPRAGTPANEVLLDQWVEAKRNKDFAIADEIRADLRAQGIEPEEHRPDPRDAARAAPMTSSFPARQASASNGRGPVVPASGSWAAEADLDRWVEAKRAKDFRVADDLRDKLRRHGIDPDQHRPRGWQPTNLPPSGSAANEALLDEWVNAKRNKDFRLADDIRADLRRQGIQPDEHRPDPMRGGEPRHDTFASRDARAAPRDAHGASRSAGRSRQQEQDDIDAMLDDWVEAKRAKDFHMADAIRADLRRLGVEPDHERPDPIRGQERSDPDQGRRGAAPERSRGPPTDARGPPADGQAPPAGSWWAEAELDRWVEAKRAKDYRVADDIRAELRKQGVDPDRMRPPGYKPTVIPPSGSAANEALLDQWVEAKRAKDFRVADEIRADLRRLGIEPDDLRPDRGRPERRHDDRENFRVSSQSRKEPEVLEPERDAGRDSGSAPPAGTWWAEAELDRWVEAKRSKQYQRADDIRANLRRHGIDPDRLRPPGWEQTVFPPSGSAATEAMLDDWVEAKRNKDFKRADALRADLRRKGLEPDDLRPDPLRGGAGPRAPPEVSTEQMLDDWVRAKRARDFTTADNIRKRLRSQGIEPDDHRPPGHGRDEGRRDEPDDER